MYQAQEPGTLGAKRSALIDTLGAKVSGVDGLKDKSA